MKKVLYNIIFYILYIGYVENYILYTGGKPRKIKGWREKILGAVENYFIGAGDPKVSIHTYEYYILT